MIGSKIFVVLFLLIACLDFVMGKFYVIVCYKSEVGNEKLLSLWPALKCHCDICTGETNHTCETDGFCFTSTSLNRKTGALVHAYRYILFLNQSCLCFWLGQLSMR